MESEEDSVVLELQFLQRHGDLQGRDPPELLRHPHCRDVQLAPLGALDELFEAPQQAADAMALTCGNPLLVRSLLDDQRLCKPRDDGGLVIGPSYRRALVSCLHRCDHHVSPVARALAVTGEQATRESLGRLARADAETVGPRWT